MRSLQTQEIDLVSGGYGFEEEEESRQETVVVVGTRTQTTDRFDHWDSPGYGSANPLDHLVIIGGGSGGSSSQSEDSTSSMENDGICPPEPFESWSEYNDYLEGIEGPNPPPSIADGRHGANVAYAVLDLLNGCHE